MFFNKLTDAINEFLSKQRAARSQVKIRKAHIFGIFLKLLLFKSTRARLASLALHSLNTKRKDLKKIVITFFRALMFNVSALYSN